MPKRKLGYDERPDPKGPGQQGVLFRNVAPAQDQQTRNHLVPEKSMGDLTKHARNRNSARETYEDPNNWRDARLQKGRATGLFSPDQFHGTAANLKPGSLVKPAGGPTNFDSMNSNGHGRTHDVNHEHAYATPNLHEAYRYAKIAQETRTNQGSRSARGNVFQVQPTGPVHIDPEDSDAREGYSDPSAFRSKHPWRVMNKVQFSDAQEAYRSYYEDELNEEPGSYPFAPKQKGYNDYW